MAFDAKLTITGIQEAQQRNLRRIAELAPTGAMGRAVQYGTTEAQRYAVSVTHVDTGALRASHRVDVSGSRGVVYLDPSASNPRSGTATARYGPYEHARGGSHAFYSRTIDERGTQIVQEMRRMISTAIAGV